VEEFLRLIEQCPVIAQGVEDGKDILHFLLDNDEIAEVVLAPSSSR
jgi:hypothetical protein